MATKCQLSGWDVSRDTIANVELRRRWVPDFEVVLDPTPSLSRSGRLLRLSQPMNRSSITICTILGPNGKVPGPMMGESGGYGYAQNSKKTDDNH